jgi:quinolinate synthase
MKIRELQEEIMALKREKNICILAHSYQTREIVEIADYTGDSFGLSIQASKTPQQTVILCGVRFMAETVKILSPEKTVYLSHPQAGCPMAEQVDREIVSAARVKYPGYTTVCYINTTAEVKTVCDVCVTSSSAVKIIERIPNENILFLPDKNLGSFLSRQLPQKNIVLLPGGCPTHVRAGRRDVERVRAEHPGALLLAHPECLPEVAEQADYVGSTTGIIEYAKTSRGKEFIIGTELSILQHLEFECPDKRFYPLSKDMVCHNMKLTTLWDVYRCMTGEAGEEIRLEEETRQKAKRCIDQMILLG